MNAGNHPGGAGPLEAFFEKVQSLSADVAMVQPLGGGRLQQHSWALMSKNCAEWILADLAIWAAGHVSVPLYPNLTSTTVRQIMEHSESRLLFVGKLDTWDEARQGVPDSIPKIALSLAPASALKDYPSWADAIAATSALDLADTAKPTAGDLATIIYTSGTTGTPKGVMHSFGTLTLMGEKLPDVYDISHRDRMISYLPLSHVAERVAVELAMLYVGQTVYFAESLETFAEDIKRARPTLFFAVPRIWTKFYQKASQALPPRKLEMLLKVPLLNRMVQKKILGAMGLDECRIALSGASALSPEVIEWFRKIGLEILEVYGMTENMAWSHATRVGDQRIGRVGTNHDGVECRIAGSGEILVRSVANMVGYYKDPGKTREDLTDDGWLHTGDKGEIDEQGRLKIIGRVKEIFKTEKGKYVAPAPIEGRFVAFSGIDQACVMGSNLPQPLVLLCIGMAVHWRAGRSRAASSGSPDHAS
ncbi:AMP-binding protein [Haliea sp. E1-2-M8]|uniref:AMP-binding protein n=1 Tax=Haliea sp. E1-2-M8 TaxID=3064706 RepID=UPI00271F5199|nr:AMP-binding protein [Haliea sp. E1-2-M8]MDO8860922.1 AMP-binding protein [Haliea sp. E1-2-M8]